MHPAPDATPGDEVVLTIMRGDQTLDISVTLDKRP